MYYTRVSIIHVWGQRESNHEEVYKSISES